MKRWVLIAVTLLTLLGLTIPGGVALAAGSWSDPIQVAEDQSFSLSLEPDYNRSYYTFTPQSDGLYAVILEGNCQYYLELFSEDRNRDKYEWMDEGEDRFVLGQLEKGVPVLFSIVSYRDPLTVTAHIATVPLFSYEVLPDGTASITGAAVDGDIVIPETIDGYTVTNLASELFYGKSGITSVHVPATVTYFGSSKSSVDFDYVFSYCYDLVRIDVDPANTAYKSVDGVLYTRDGRHLVNYPCARPGERYHTSAEVLSCTSFARCKNLKYLYLDNSETYWMGYTFYNTSDLTTLYQPGGYSETRALSFMESHSGESVWCTFRPWSESLVADLRLPAQLTAIDSEAFAGITDMVIDVPDSVAQIADGAFDPSVTLYCSMGSAAEKYCAQNGLKCILK